MSDDTSDDGSMSLEEDSDSGLMSFIKKSTISYILSLSTAAILFTISFLSINWMSAIYLFGGCLYLARLIDERKCALFLIYSVLGVGCKIFVLILAYTTNYFDTDTTPADSRNFKLDLFNSIGFSFISMETKAIILSFAEDLIVIIGLSVVMILNHRLTVMRRGIKSPSEKSSLDDPGAITTHTIIISHIWFWLMTIFLVLVYIFGHSALYMIMFCKP
jgi:hypothetical protein